MRSLCLKLLLFLCCLVDASLVNAGEKRSGVDVLTIAVASNFFPTMQRLVDAYSTSSEQNIRLSSGSSGKHVAQIYQGAPFDLFFSADVARAKKLDDSGHALTGSRFTYAIGRLALLSNDEIQVNNPYSVFDSPNLQHVAIANPRLAPYGVAAQQTLMSLGRWKGMKSKLVKGENVTQAYQFVSSGNAQLGLVSYAQVVAIGDSKQRLNVMLIPQEHHKQIEQQAVVLNDSIEANEFIHFVRSPVAQKIIQAHGYQVP